MTKLRYLLLFMGFCSLPLYAAQGGGSGCSGPTYHDASIPEAPPLGFPSGLTAVAGTSQVSLSWTAATNATFHRVNRSTRSHSDYIIVADTTGTTYVDTTVTNGTLYYYDITALNTGYGQTASDEVSARPVDPSIPIPSPPTNVLLGPWGSALKLTWTAAAGADRYNVYRSTTSGGPYDLIAVDVAATEYEDLGLPTGIVYFYGITSLSAGGESAASTEVSGAR